LKDSIVARRYAKSLVKSTSDEGELRVLLEEFRSVAGVLGGPPLTEFWKNPGISVARKVEAAGELASRIGVSKRLGSFLRVLAQKNRIKSLPVVYEEFARMAHEALGEVIIVVETPFELTEEEANDLSSILRRKLGRKIILEMRLQEDLIAGARIRVGDKVIDGSLKAKLESLREAVSS